MRHGHSLLPLLAAIALAVPVTAQQWPDSPGASGQFPNLPSEEKAKPKAKPKPKPSSEATDELTPAQIRRAQQQPDLPSSPDDMPKAVKRGAPPKAAPARDVNCKGPFGADSGHVRLAQVFGTDNVVFSDVDGPGGKLQASILYPKDPKRRLELLWKNNTSRSGLMVIAINGQSTWTAPKGVRVGMPIAAVEKINGKPFNLTGFSSEGSSASDWQGGALLNLPGGCKMGMRFIMDQRATAEARDAVSGSKELQSSDASVRAVRPTVTEILIGF
jgi:hypothetical protein